MQVSLDALTKGLRRDSVKHGSHMPIAMPLLRLGNGFQVADRKLKDTKGGYARFMSENKQEAKIMEDKEQRQKVIAQDNTKSKSKVQYMCTCNRFLKIAACFFNHTLLVALHQVTCNLLRTCNFAACEGVAGCYKAVARCWGWSTIDELCKSSIQLP